MYAEGETELRDLIVQNLENCGFLDKIKAELRAGVFLAFEEDGNMRKNISLFDKKFDAFIETSHGKLAVSIVREFLEYFNLNFTLSVFNPEIASSSPLLCRTELCSKLNIDDADFDGPVLSTLLKSEHSSGGIKASKNPSLRPQNSASSFQTPGKTLETIAEDLPSKGKDEIKNLPSQANTATKFSLNNETNDIFDKESTSNGGTFSTRHEPSRSDLDKKSNTQMINKLINDSSRFESQDKEKSKISDIFNKTESNVDDIFKENEDSTGLHHDPFFDEPLPIEKPSFFNLPSESVFGASGFKGTLQSKTGSSSKLESESNVLSSLKNLPALTTKSNSWTIGRDLPKTLPSLDSSKPVPLLENLEENKVESDNESKKRDLEPDSNEDSSDRQIISEESIEEEIEEDFSVGMDDLLNSSLSLGDDATSDQTVSQISVVDGVDHIEAISN